MAAAPILTSRALVAAAKQHLAVSSVASVASGYARSLRPCEARFSQSQGTISSDGDR
jgi:hypothetical protein